MLRRRASRRSIRLAAAIALLCLATSCGTRGLPERGQRVLDESISQLASKAEYTIISVEKAKGTPEDQRVELEFPTGGQLGACPPDTGDKETWCVVIQPGLGDTAGSTCSHFLVTRIGQSWYAQALTDAEAPQFEYMGCSNWDAS